MQKTFYQRVHRSAENMLSGDGSARRASWSAPPLAYRRGRSQGPCRTRTWGIIELQGGRDVGAYRIKASVLQLDAAQIGFFFSELNFIDFNFILSGLLCRMHMLAAIALDFLLSTKFSKMLATSWRNTVREGRRDMCPRKDLDGEGPPRIAGLEARRRPVEPITCAQNRQGGEVAKLQYVNVIRLI